MSSVKALKDINVPPFHLDLCTKPVQKAREIAEQLALMQKHIKRGITLPKLLQTFDKEILTTPNFRGETIFHIACRLGNANLVVQLVEFGNTEKGLIADFFEKAQLAKCKSGMIPLHHALIHCIPDSAALALLNFPIVRDEAVKIPTERNSLTPLHLACSRRNVSEELVEELLSIDWIRLEGWKQVSANNAVPFVLLCETPRCSENLILRLLGLPSVSESISLQSEGWINPDKAILYLLALHYSEKAVCKAVQGFRENVNQLIPMIVQKKMFPRTVTHLFTEFPDILYTILTVGSYRDDLSASADQYKGAHVLRAIRDSKHLFTQLSALRDHFYGITVSAMHRMGRKVLGRGRLESDTTQSTIMLQWGTQQYACHRFVLRKWKNMPAVDTGAVHSPVVNVFSIFPLQHTLETFLRFLYGLLDTQDLIMNDMQMRALVNSLKMAKCRDWSVFVYIYFQTHMSNEMVWKLLEWNHDGESKLLYHLCFEYLSAQHGSNVLLAAFDDHINLNLPWMRVVIEKYGTGNPQPTQQHAAETIFDLPEGQIQSPLTWQSACLKETIAQLRRKDAKPDLIIVDQDSQREFPCHREVLCECFPYLRALLSSGMRESYAGKVSLYSADLILSLLFGRTDFPIHSSDIARALIFAEKYQLKDEKPLLLASLLEFFAVLEVDELLEILREASCTQEELLAQMDSFQNISKEKLTSLWVNCFAQIGGCADWKRARSGRIGDPNDLLL